MLGMEKGEDLVELCLEEEKGFSECSSGCQSGWTVYLSPTTTPTGERETSAVEEEEGDLSMLSDASSGPPHIKEDSFHWLVPSSKKRRVFEREQKKKMMGRHKEHSSFLDDTASSPLQCYPKTVYSSNNHPVEDVFELSCGFSGNHDKGNAALRKKNVCPHPIVPLNPATVYGEKSEEKFL
ncbi:hypothetical protein HPP92_019970 [Vanilla planifolia]|uniref:Uncharacterized protein n=1 Tax=Vanilla planifolia TaxID=51239 RepID=A0A835UNE6_VANPL|nr:hypothetical protein HPP92_019970 [Vanilla planifolia]